MARKINPITAILLFIPAFYVIWSLILNHLSGPHFLSRSDPEYVYLLNGMNAALLKFDRIGHVDHPGTPFQMITGLFITLIYWISGSRSLVSDVISEPEKYLFISSFFLSFITSVLIFWISKLEYKRSQSLSGALIIPLSLFIYIVIVDLPSRYIPDRFLMIILLFFTGLCIKYFYLGFPVKKFAIFSGILMAAGLVTKINFIPFVILPLFIVRGIKGKVTYGVSIAISAVLLFLPVYDKFNQFWQFAVQISTHEGLYGSGNEQVLNPQVFTQNLLFILKDNPGFGFILLLAAINLIYFMIRSRARKEHFNEFSFLVGFLVVAVFSTFLVAKHYKNYYMIPILSISGLALYVVWVFSSRIRLQRISLYVLIPAGIIFLYLAGNTLVPGYENRKNHKYQEMRTVNFIQNTIPDRDYFFIEPTWMAGPMVTNGLVYGISYIGHRFYFYNDYEKIYPNVITYEGWGKPLKYFRTLDADNESILKSGKDIYLLSTPGRNSGLMNNYLDSCAQSYDIRLVCDTIYNNEVLKTQVLRISNSSGWKTRHQVNCGFEEVRDGRLYSDDGKVPLEGSFVLTAENFTNGAYALALGKDIFQSPVIQIDDVCKDDYIEVTVKRERMGNGETGTLTAYFAGSNGEMKEAANNKSLSAINSRWELVRLTFTLEDQPADSILFCHYTFKGDDEQRIDDFVVRHFSKMQ